MILESKPYQSQSALRSYLDARNEEFKMAAERETTTTTEQAARNLADYHRDRRGPKFSVPPPTPWANPIDIYASYRRYAAWIGSPVLSFEDWTALKPLIDEVKAYKKDTFLASLHPDGGNLAGFHQIESSFEGDHA